MDEDMNIGEDVDEEVACLSEHRGSSITLNNMGCEMLIKTISLLQEHEITVDNILLQNCEVYDSQMATLINSSKNSNVTIDGGWVRLCTKAGMLSFQDMFNKDPNSLSTARVMCQIPPEEQTYQSVVGGRELTIDQDCTWTKEMGEGLAAACKQSRNLQEMWLGGKNIDSVRSEDMADLVSRVMRLLVQSALTEGQWMEICKRVVSGTCKVEKIRLGKDCCQFAGAESVAEIFCRMKSIRVLCPLSERAWREVGKRVTGKDSALENLWLGKNSCKFADGDTVAEIVSHVKMVEVGCTLTKVMWRKIGRKVVFGHAKLEVLKLCNDCCRNADEETVVEVVCHVRRAEVGCPLTEEMWRRIEGRLASVTTVRSKIQTLHLFGGNEVYVKQLNLKNINRLLT